MAWVEVRRNAAKARVGVALRVSRQRLRNDEFLYLLRIRISEPVLAEAGLEIGSAVDLLRGVSEDAGKLRVQATAGRGRPFNISRAGQSGLVVGHISVPAALLGMEKPPVGPSTAVSCRTEANAIEIVLPDVLLRNRKNEKGRSPSPQGGDARDDEGSSGSKAADGDLAQISPSIAAVGQVVRN